MSDDLISQMADQNKANFAALKEEADKVGDASEARLIGMFKEHLKETEEMCIM
jgi:hypothetical protein